MGNIKIELRENDRKKIHGDWFLCYWYWGIRWGVSEFRLGAYIFTVQ